MIAAASTKAGKVTFGRWPAVWAIMLLAVCQVATALGQSAEGRRVALVIGNGAYERAGDALPNPPNDARDMAAKLRTLDFEVIEAVDRDYRGMRQALRAFERALPGASAGLFFYAGHGMEYRGQNYLFPIDAVLETEGDIGFGLVGMQQVLQIMERSVPTRLVFLDACRNNPLARRFRGALGSSTRTSEPSGGLARMDAGQGTFIAYATAPGDIAEDGAGDNSPFTAALLEQLDEPGVDVSVLMRNVRREVANATGFRQTPWESSSLLNPFVFNLEIEVTIEQTPLPENSVDDNRAEIVFWETIEDSERPAAFEAYLDRYGEDGLFGPLAQTRLDALLTETLETAHSELPSPRPVQSSLNVSRDEAVGETFKDCAHCPEMVVVPAGEFLMGSPKDEIGRDEDESPQHRVTIAEPFAVGRFEVTRGEYRHFIEESGHAAGNACWTLEDREWKERRARSWNDPAFSQGDDHPAVCVSWQDAKAYVDWLSHKTGKAFRLPSEAEWEYVSRANTTSRRFWGDDRMESEACRYSNGNDATSVRINAFSWGALACDDKFAQTAPVDSFAANGFGLHDTSGNVWEWVEDRWHSSYEGAPSDGTAWITGTNAERVVRGGSWGILPDGLRSANRDWYGSTTRTSGIGFRVARTLR